MVSMNKLSTTERAAIVSALVEGNSIRATCRMTGAAKNTVVKLLMELGEACWKYQSETMRNLKCERFQADEIWAFCYSKQRNVPEDKKGQFGVGDVWTWTALCADCKVVPTFLVGNRDAEYAEVFLRDLSQRLARRVQLTTDGHKAYLVAVERVFGSAIDYSQLVKLYGKPVDAPEARYSPPECVGTQTHVISGKPDIAHVSTSYVERQNLNMRMGMRRFTRLTNGFSRKWQNLEAAESLYFLHYNFARPHTTLSKPYPMTPAMKAGVSDHVWTVAEIVGLLDREDSN